MSRIASVVVMLAALLSHFSLATASAEEALKAGDRVVFLGDSITQAGAGPNGYVTLVRQELEKVRPDLKVEVIGAGISGNRVPDLEKRLERDVLSKKPTVVVIYIGINDVWHSLNGRGTTKDDFEAGLKRIIAKINEAGARVILCTPTVIGEKIDGSNKLDEMLEEYCEISRKVATDTKSHMNDLRKQFIDHLKKANKSNADKGILTSDTVHLNQAGNQFLASSMLAALGVHPVKAQVLRHVVLFKFKAEVTKEQVDEVVAAFGALPGKIPEIVDFEWGTDVSVENKSEGLTHGFVVTFKDEKGREIYLPHPAHQEFVKLVGPRVEKVVVFDFWVGK